MVVKKPSIIESIYIFNRRTVKLVKAELWHEITKKNISDSRKEWEPYHEWVRDQFKALGIDEDRWPESGHWQWEKKFNEQQRLSTQDNVSFAIVADDMTQAMIYANLTTTGESSRLSNAEHSSIYVDALEVAPWNYPNLVNDAPLYAHCGSLLMYAAIKMGMYKGTNGRVGLHSLPQANEFYEHIGMDNFGVDKEKENMNYFEFTPKKAKNYIEEVNKKRSK